MDRAPSFKAKEWGQEFDYGFTLYEGTVYHLYEITRPWEGPATPSDTTEYDFEARCVNTETGADC